MRRLQLRRSPLREGLLGGLLAGLGACGGTDGPPMIPDSPTPAADGRWPEIAGLDCAAPIGGPKPATVVVDSLGSAEDLAFDGQGHFVAVGDDGLLRIAADGKTSSLPLATKVGFLAGLRYGAGGTLYAAEFLGNRIVAIAPDGQVTPLVSDLEGPNGLSPGADGHLWFSESRAGRIRRRGPAGDVVDVVPAGGAPGANGLVFDRHRLLVFYAAGLGEGELVIQRVGFDAAGAAQAPEVLWQRTPGNADGLALDACGHLYVVDNHTTDSDKTRRIWRLQLDEAGAVRGEPELVTTIDRSATNLAFGMGPGFEPTDLYVTGFDGTVFRVPVGVPGARTAASAPAP